MITIHSYKCIYKHTIVCCNSNNIHLIHVNKVKIYKLIDTKINYKTKQIRI